MQRAVDKPRLGKVVNQKFSIVLAVAATRHPANHVVPARRSEGQNQNKLVADLFTGQLHQHKVRIDRLYLLAVLIVQRNLLRHIPNVFALEKHLRILRVIKPINLALGANQCLGVTDVCAQVCRHLTGILKQRWKRGSIGLNQRVVRIKNIKVNGSVVGIDRHLNAVANVVDVVLPNVLVPRIGIG